MHRLAASVFFLLLASTVALTLEEGVHLYNHPQGWPPDNLTLLHHPGCSGGSDDHRVIRCPVDGYNSALFLCSDESCRFKEPANGVRVTPYEERIWNIYMRKHAREQLIQLRKRLEDGTIDDSFIQSDMVHHD